MGENYFLSAFLYFSNLTAFLYFSRRSFIAGSEGSLLSLVRRMARSWVSTAFSASPESK